MAQQDKKDREEKPRRRAADADAAGTDESTTEPDTKQKVRDRLRRWRKPLIGLGIAGAAAPVAGKAKAAETFRTVRTSRAERGETAEERARDVEETLAARVGEEIAEDASGDPISKAISRYGISRQLAKDIYDIARQEGIDPGVAFGLVRTESSFREQVVSHAGAVGLAQVLPRTANWLVPGTSRQDLFDRRTNLSVGFRYLNYLLRKYDGDMKLALTAYNRGPGTVDRVLARGGDPDNGYAGKVLGG